MAIRFARKVSFRLTSLSVLAMTSLWASTAGAQNLISNGTFDAAADAEDYGPWWGYAADEFMQTLGVANGELCSTIDAGGENPWDIILGYSGVPLVANQHYHISFTAWADVERPVRYKTGLGDAPYTDYYLGKITVTPAPQVFDVTYLNLRDNPDGQFQFQFGGSNGMVCFDNIVVEPVAAPVLPAYVTPSTTGASLKNYTSLIKMGTAVDTPIFLSSPVHNSIVAGEFNMITPANSMKMNIIQPEQGVFDFTETDALLIWAQQNGLEFHGHPLVWHTQAPGWLNDGEFDRDAMIAIMYAHIDALMGRYKGNVPYWDVVNEAVEQTDGVWGFRSTIWHDRIGPDFIDLAFQRAAAYDPSAKFLYNDYNIAVMGNPKADYVFQMISDMKARGIPVTTIGMQNHWYITADGGSSGLPDVAMIRANMDRYAGIGVDVQFTEVDIRIGLPMTPEKDALQAQVYRDLLQACVDAPNCSHFTVWGLSDIDSWVPSTFPDMDFAHIFDAGFVAKTSYHAFTQVLAAYPTDAMGGVMAGGAGDPGQTPAAQAESGGCAMGRSLGSPSAPWSLLALFGFLFALRARSPRPVALRRASH